MRVPPWIAVALAVPASVDAQFVLRIGYNNNPPYYSPTPQGPPEGLVVDMFTQSAKEAGIVLEWVFAPGAPDAAMREDKFDLYAMSIVTDQRRTEFYLTDPWTTTEAWMVWLEGKEPKTPSLAGELLGVPESRFFQDIANRHFPGSRYHIRPSRSELLGDLCAEKIIAVLMEARSVTSSLLDRPARCNGVPLRIDLVQGTYQGLAILAKKQFRSYADQLHDGLVRQARDGSLAANYRKWRIGFAPELQLTDQLNRSNQARLFYELTTAAGAVLVVLCLFLVWRLRQAKRQAEGLTELKSRLLANVSHELRTPITGVIGLTEELRETPLSAAQTEIVSTVQASSRGLLRLLNDMLDLSRLEAGKLVIEQIPFLLTEPAAAVTTMLSHAAADNSVTLRLNAGGQEDRFVTGDPARLSQVLLNLAGNAVKFSPGGTVEVSIQPLGGDTYRFQVADTGIGMDSATVARLFQPFSQGDASTARRFGGTGLGLSIAYRLIHNLGGELKVSSAPGKGSRFWFDLRLPSGPRPAPAPAPPIQTPSMRILVVDDVAVNRRVAVRLCESIGHQVHAVSSGRDAIEACRAREYDVILMDCQMPEMDGYETTRRIRAEEKAGHRVRIIALTANAFDSDKADSRKAGMDFHLSKPYTKAELAAALSSVAVY